MNIENQEPRFYWSTIVMTIETEEKPPCVEEQYSVAVGSSNLRVENDSNRRNIADLIIASGMSKHRMGAALGRLATEWGAVGKPPIPTPSNIEAIAAKYPRIPGTGLVAVKTTNRDGEVVEEQLNPLVAAKREAEAWHAHELGLLFQRLNTLPEVRAGLIHWAECKEFEGAIHVVAAVLQWWLSPRCPVCYGVKKRIVAGTNRTGSKDCRECKGTGEIKVPHGPVGRRLLGYMNECRRSWAGDVRARNRNNHLKQ